MKKVGNPLITPEEAFDLFAKKSDEKENIAFIFGAGASYGYSENPNTSFVPPIVADLFNEQNTTVRNVINQPKHSYVLGQRDYLVEALENFDNDLERYLSFLYNKNDDDDTFSDLLLYIQDLCWLASENIDTTRNNYKDLINRMSTLRGKLPWTCISFNYDSILERSFIAAGRDRTRQFDANEDYLQRNPKILKMHGSINFRYVLQELKNGRLRTERDVFSAMMREKKLAGSSSVTQSLKASMPPFLSETAEWNVEKQDRDNFDVYNYPLMMIPIHNTKRSEHPFFEYILEEARREIDASSLVVAVGYNFGDELLLEQLKEIDLSNKHLILVGTPNLYLDPDSHTGYQNAVNNWGDAKIQAFIGNGFGGFVRAISKRIVSEF